MTVEDPTHPLYGRRFRVASRATRPGSRASYVLVFYRDELLLQIASSALLPPADGRFPRTKITPDAVAELIATARDCGTCPSTHDTSGRRCPTRCERASSRT